MSQRVPRIYKGGKIGKNQTLLRYESFGDTDFIVTITTDTVTAYIARTTAATFVDARRQAGIMRASDVRGWEAIMGDDERFYEFTKALHYKACKRLYEIHKPKSPTIYALMWFNRRICIKEFKNKRLALKAYENNQYACSLSVRKDGRWSGMVSKRPETLIRAFREQPSVTSPRGLQIERETCRDRITSCVGCPIKDCETMRKVKGEPK